MRFQANGEIAASACLLASDTSATKLQRLCLQLRQTIDRGSCQELPRTMAYSQDVHGLEANGEENPVLPLIVWRISTLA